MSADAKLWQDDNDDWCAVHDGECAVGEHRVGPYELERLMQDVNTCMGEPSIHRWVLRTYPDGKAGLSGYAW